MEIPVPVIKEVDVLIIGAMLSGCELSLYLRQAGRRVLVTSSGASLGDDIVGQLNKKACASPTLGNLAGTPAAIQAQLDRLLLNAGAEFLFGVTPIRPLYENGTRRLAGWVFFGGNNYFAIAAKAVVDGTWDGALPFQMRLNRRSTGIAECPVLWNLVGACRPPADIPDATLEVSLAPLNADGQTTAFCQYQRSFRLRQNDTAGILHAEMMLRRDALTPNTIHAAYWPKFNFSNHAWDSIQTTRELPLYRAGAADVSMLLQETIPAVPIAHSFQGIESRLEPTDCSLVWKNHVPRPTAGKPRVSLTLETLSAEAPAWDIVVVGTGADAVSAARTAARRGCRVLLLASADSLGGDFPGLVDEGVEVWFHTQVGGVLLRQHAVAGVLIIADNGTTCLVHAAIVIDATGCGSIAAGAGAPMHYPHEPEPITHGAVVAPRIPSNPFGSLDESRYFINDPWDMTYAFVLAHFRGEEHFAVEPPGLRDDRPRILGEITLLPQDLVLRNRHEDAIAFSRCAFPNAADSCHPLLWMEKFDQTHLEAWIPLRAILPLRVDGLLVLGNALSAHKDVARAFGSEELLSREGVAAALLACLAIKSGTTLRKLDVRPVQEELVASGLLPPEVLTRESESESQENLALAAIFHRPDQARRILQAQFEHNQDLRTATILAFLGDSSGRAILSSAICGTEGTSCDQDFCTLASAFTTIGGSPTGMLEKLATLTPQTSLPILRVLCLFFQRWPSRAAAPPLRKLLDALQTGLFPQENDLVRSIRTAQNTPQGSRLKCLYLAMALHACDPADSEANDVLENARHSWRLLEALLADEAGK